MAEQERAPLRPPLEETPEAAAAVEDDTTVPQLMTSPGVGGDNPAFRAPGGDRDGGPDLRTGAEQPWDPEDLAAAQGRDQTPAQVERARRELDRDGAAAVERTVP